MADEQSNIQANPKSIGIGMNLNSVASQVQNGMTTWAINAIVESFDGNQTTYSNEQANILCTEFPVGYRVIGQKNIIEEGYILVWLANPQTGQSEIGKVRDCVYTKYINADCLGLSVDFPIHKSVYRKTDCSSEIFWVDNNKRNRYLDLNNPSYITIKGVNNCEDVPSTEIDCNKLNIQPDFPVPEITIRAVDTGRELQAGTYQFAAAYVDKFGEQFTSYYSVTNPLPIFDPNKITQDFNYVVGKSINVQLSHLDTSGLFTHINLAVIKTVNNIPTPYLVGTYSLRGESLNINYTGQSLKQLDINDILEKFPIYDKANDITTAQDTLILDQLTTQERISYQLIANQITVNWQTWRVPADKAYANSLNATYLKGYMRDEIYPLELVLLMDNGWQTDGFHIPGRVATEDDLIPVFNDDVVNEKTDNCSPAPLPLPTWQVYNTGCLIDFEQTYKDYIQGITYPCPKCPPVYNTDTAKAECYTGPYQYGCMAYTESTELYPCNEDIWGQLAGQPIRHHRFPDSLITHIHDSQGYIYPIGFRIDIQQIVDLINSSTLTQEQRSRIQGFKIVRGNRAGNKSVVAKGILHNVGRVTANDQTFYYPNYPYNDLRADKFLSYVETGNDSGLNVDKRIQGFNTDASKQRYTFHSPDTHFFQPSIGNILKLETAEYGKSKGNFVEVKKESRYKLISTASYLLAIGIGIAVALTPNSAGVVVGTPGLGAGFTAYSLVLDIIEKLIPRVNYATQFNSIGEYTNYTPVNNTGNKQRQIDLSSYILPGLQSVGDDSLINNYQRESSVYLKTNKTLLFPSQLPSVPEDTSRYLLSEQFLPGKYNYIQEQNISSYYGSIKKNFSNQYGQIYSYETIDTGFQFFPSFTELVDPQERIASIFGGDIFINRFAYKSKIPFFLDNRVGFRDDADVEFNEIPNLANPIFWMSTATEASGSGGFLPGLSQLFGVKQNNFDLPGSKFFYQTGKFYLFSYGIPYFYVESEVNVDLRQAFNDKEGDFFPHVSTSIPNDWLQEIQTSIQFDNTYTYNKTFSKQNKENSFTHIPDDFLLGNICEETFPFKAAFSEDWLKFRPSATFDFPQNYGRLISLDGIGTAQVLARFENKSLLYNALLTAPSSVADIYLGQSLFQSSVPPIDYAETDQGYVGTQHKFLLKTEWGMVTVDAKRGQVFLINGQSLKELTQDTETQQVSKFFTEFLSFQIQKAFPNVPIDNHFSGIGLHGVYDSRYNRLILTKLDYKPLFNDISYANGKFFRQGKEIQLSDRANFCNYSFTISYDFENQAWISFHTYLPNYYIGDANLFYSGLNLATPTLWQHSTEFTKFNNFYGEIHPYVIEYSYSRSFFDEILQNIKDYSRVLKYTDFQEFIETDDEYFNKCTIYSNQQSSGILELDPKPKNNLKLYNTYPKYNTNSKTITYTKSGSFYQMNTFWDMVKSTKKPIWLKSCENLSIYKELNEENLDYSKRSRLKAPIRSKELKIRFILDNKDDIKIVSSFTVAPSQVSYK